ncbi:hypothetical protein [Pseudoalteromonas luteoviolacea]|uniref:Uncharacterized protein n=1 Tax=Pseudoalteromonas luteoviolacea S4054 TaxID=1129367 RepID=A0A0F6AC98_9GAMM|nr:hypothetical protein [Pseudoalteromonas luteoviolacea]AOT06705.1 hypothetical protein S4054249_01875 [Pseudoalteromonas luteoviolacea]AOT11623.1 hypothetical protein S40542_01875 [Pseudoalteromonas luteoviolacea]AOT16535.1 hypothetical protein S4054_01875 [Pseudoalteromonas luteoviolacea]KKE83793.1 hypothetical protein N479_12435 [Pseudoalteromonas luteoviolacea S4054]KZN73924.1 hypothetical protein N481_10820 [Pseudoalteromonas luteoviolacea S4047-1]
MKVTNLLKSLILATLVGTSAMTHALVEGELTKRAEAVAKAEGITMAELLDRSESGELDVNQRAAELNPEWGRCETYKYTKYASAKIDQEVTLTRFSSFGSSCNSYAFTIERNYDGHDMELLLYRDGRVIDSGTHIGRYLSQGSYILKLRNNGGGTGTRGGVRYEYREN